MCRCHHSARGCGARSAGILGQMRGRIGMSEPPLVYSGRKEMAVLSDPLQRRPESRGIENAHPHNGNCNCVAGGARSCSMVGTWQREKTTTGHAKDGRWVNTSVKHNSL